LWQETVAGLPGAYASRTIFMPLPLVGLPRGGDFRLQDRQKSE